MTTTVSWPAATWLHASLLMAVELPDAPRLERGPQTAVQRFGERRVARFAGRRDGFADDARAVIAL